MLTLKTRIPSHVHEAFVYLCSFKGIDLAYDRSTLHASIKKENHFTFVVATPTEGGIKAAYYRCNDPPYERNVGFFRNHKDVFLRESLLIPQMHEPLGATLLAELDSLASPKGVSRPRADTRLLKRCLSMFQRLPADTLLLRSEDATCALRVRELEQTVSVFFEKEDHVTVVRSGMDSTYADIACRSFDAREVVPMLGLTWNAPRDVVVYRDMGIRDLFLELCSYTGLRELTLKNDTIGIGQETICVLRGSLCKQDSQGATLELGNDIHSIVGNFTQNFERSMVPRELYDAMAGPDLTITFRDGQVLPRK